MSGGVLAGAPVAAQRILVAGVGNLFLGDDGFGPAVARRLAQRSWPEGVRVVDFGIRGIDLTYALLDGYDAAILIDATRRGGEPGTLYLLAPEVDDARPEPGALGIEPHDMNPTKVLALVRAMGGEIGCLRVIGCEPEGIGSDEEMVMGLSASVAAAVDGAVDMAARLVAELRQGSHGDA
jgi:hydrogenase maturation protease